MNLERLSPWNWFKSEEESRENQVPARYTGFDRGFPMSRIHDDIDRMFDDFFRGFTVPSLFEGSTLAAHPTLLRPNLDIEEKDAHYVITVEVPGVDQSNVEIQVDGRSLVISGEKTKETRDETATYHRVERSYGSFRRVLSLPENADAGKIDATFDNGVLKIEVAKSAAAPSETRKVSIKHGS